MANQNTTTNRPVHTVRIGSIKAAVWENQTDDGPRHAVTFSRGYQVEEGWKDTGSFRPRDLPVLMKVADLAFDWIHATEERLGR